MTLYKRSEAGPDHILQVLPQPPGGALSGAVVPPRQGINPEVRLALLVTTPTTCHDNVTATLNLYN